MEDFLYTTHTSQEEAAAPRRSKHSISEARMAAEAARKSKGPSFGDLTSISSAILISGRAKRVDEIPSGDLEVFLDANHPPHYDKNSIWPNVDFFTISQSSPKKDFPP